MSKKQIIFIVNPRSGMERRKEIQQAIDNILDKETYSWEIRNTEYAKHGTVLAREAAEQGAWAVVAVGGDGSVNDVAQGLAGTNTILAILPKGSGNGMARNMKIPVNDITGAMKVINKGNVATIDVGYANGRLFLSNAGVAFDALISKKFADSERRGFMVYSWLVTKYLWLYKTLEFKVSVDGKEFTDRAFMINVANGQQFGYNFYIAPMASFTDGLLDLVVIRKFPRILGALIALHAMKGTLASSRYVKHMTGKEIVISHPSLKLMQVDGDAHPCENRIVFTVKPASLKVLMP